MTAQEAFDERLKQYQTKINEIELDYKLHREVYKKTISLATTYQKYGSAKEAIPAPFNFNPKESLNNSPTFHYIEMKPHLIGDPVQDTWNIWGEAEHVAYKVIRARMP